MADSTVKFSGSVPENYDRHLLPAMFTPYAEELVRRVLAVKPEAVLETACGTGALTRMLRAQLPVTTRLVATDLNPPMLDYAKTKVPTSPPTEWKPEDMSALSFPDGTFDAVVCGFGVMFLPDKAAGVKQARRVLRKGGLYAFSVWDSLEANPYARLTYDIAVRFFPQNPPRFFDIPYGYHDRDNLRRLMEGNGFAQVQVDAIAHEARATSALSFATGLYQGTPYAGAIAERAGSFGPMVEFLAAELTKLGGAEPHRSPQRAIVITGIAA